MIVESVERPVEGGDANKARGQPKACEPVTERCGSEDSPRLKALRAGQQQRRREDPWKAPAVAGSPNSDDSQGQQRQPGVVRAFAIFHQRLQPPGQEGLSTIEIDRMRQKVQR